MKQSHIITDIPYRLTPWIFGATYIKDFDPFAVGREDVKDTASVTPFAADAIEALGSPRSLTQRTWAVVHDGNRLVVGMACAGQLITGGPVQDHLSRPLHYFLGYAWRGTDPSPYFPMDHRLFDVLFHVYVWPQFNVDFPGVLLIEHEILFSVTTKGDGRYRYKLTCPDWTTAQISAGTVEVTGPSPEIRDGTTSLSLRGDTTTIFPATETDGLVGLDLWNLALLGSNRPLSLCVGYLSEDRRSRTPFGNITLPSCTARNEVLKKQETKSSVSRQTQDQRLVPDTANKEWKYQHPTEWTSSWPIDNKSRVKQDASRLKQDLITQIIAILNCLSLGKLERILGKLKRMQQRDQVRWSTSPSSNEASASSGGESNAKQLRERMKRSSQETQQGGNSFSALLGGRTDTPSELIQPPQVASSPDSSDSDSNPMTPNPISSEPGRQQSNDERLEAQRKRNLK